MALIVHKYGGTSMGSTERIRNVARRVAKWARAGHQMVVVPSAMSGETNRLLGLARELAPAKAGAPGSPPEASINLVVLTVLLGFLLLGVVNKAVVTTARRQGELAMLRLIGATPSQIRAVMRREAGLLSVAAVGSGLAGTGALAVPEAVWVTGLAGAPLDWLVAGRVPAPVPVVVLAPMKKLDHAATAASSSSRITVRIRPR